MTRPLKKEESGETHGKKVHGGTVQGGNRDAHSFPVCLDPPPFDRLE
jgi:hypothetical protein